jgi:hypothetical protein
MAMAAEAKAVEPTQSSRWTAAAYVTGLAVASVVVLYVAHIPVQVSDSVGNLIQIQQVGYQEMFEAHLLNFSYIRPMLWVQIKAAYHLAQGHYWLTFKAIHALQLLATAALFVRLLRVRSFSDVAIVPLALMVLFGLHTFNGTVREAVPVNAFLAIIVVVLAAVNLAVSRPHWANDVLAVGLFVFGLLTLESGLLVVVALVAARMAGLHGVSRWGVFACVALTAGYLFMRFGPLGLGTPGLAERSSGYGLSMLEPDELVRRFSANPMMFYAYNVACSLLTVLFSEPRAGVWRVVRHLVEQDELPPWLIVNLTSSALATIVVARYGLRALRRWWAGQSIHGDRVAFVSLGILTANAVLSFGYTKNVIMSTGGVFFALLVYQAVVDLSSGFERMRWAPRALGLAVVMALSVSWSVRAAGLPVLLREEAFSARNDWATVYQWFEDQGLDSHGRDAAPLVEQLRSKALDMAVPNPELDKSDFHELFDLD